MPREFVNRVKEEAKNRIDSMRNEMEGYKIRISGFDFKDQVAKTTNLQLIKPGLRNSILVE